MPWAGEVRPLPCARCKGQHAYTFRFATIDAVLRDTADDMLGLDGGAWLVEALRPHGGQIRLAHELGVKILAGTDAGMNPHGVVAQEIRLLHSFGLPAAAAVAAASWEARAFLGLPGIEVGAPADLVVFPDDLLEDLAEVLQ